MIDYIVHRDYTGATLSSKGEDITLSRGTKMFLMEDTGYIFLEGFVPVCTQHSYVADQYFCRDDDNNGLMRGKLTWAIAFANRQRIHSDGMVSRFSEEELEEICNNWKKFIREDCPDVILFNTDFFNADINELKQFAKSINIKVDLSEFDDTSSDSTLSENNNVEKKTDEISKVPYENINLTNNKIRENINSIDNKMHVNEISNQIVEETDSTNILKTRRELINALKKPKKMIKNNIKEEDMHGKNIKTVNKIFIH